MKKWLRIAAVCLAVVAVGGMAWWAFQPQEPVYHGKKLSEWLRGAYSSGGKEEVDSFEQSELAVRAMGTNAVPFLIKMLRQRDSMLKIKLTQLVEQQDFVNIHFVEASDIRYQAENGCFMLGPGAREALPQLEEVFRTDNDGEAVGYAIASVDPKGVTFLIGQLTNTNAYLRSSAATSLRIIKPWRTKAGEEHIVTPDWTAQADLAIPQLIKILTNKSDWVRERAALTLGTFQRQPQIVIPALISMASETNIVGSNDARRYAIQALGKFGPEASNAVLVLLLAANDASNLILRVYAQSALKQIDPEAAAKAGVK